MLEKLHRQHTSNEHYLKPKSSLTKAFGINHFAGLVWYEAEGVLDKNRDTFSPDLFDLLHTTKDAHLNGLFKERKPWFVHYKLIILKLLAISYWLKYQACVFCNNISSK